MSDNKLKIDVVLADVGESGAVLSDFVTQELHNTDMAKKADLVNGKVNPTQLPSFNELDGVTQEIVQITETLRTEVSEKFDAAKEYADQIVSQVKTSKADLQNGRVPKEQATIFKNIPGAKETIDSLKQIFSTKLQDLKNDISFNYAKLINGKISDINLPSTIVYSKQLDEELGRVSSTIQNLSVHVNTSIADIITKTNDKYITKKDADIFTKDSELKIAVDTLDRKSQSTYAKKSVEITKADKTYVDSVISTWSGGYFKSYQSLSAANSDIANIPLNVSVKILSEDGGDYYKQYSNSTSLTKSPYDLEKRVQDTIDKLDNNIGIANDRVKRTQKRFHYTLDGSNVITDSNDALFSVDIDVTPGEIFVVNTDVLDGNIVGRLYITDISRNLLFFLNSDQINAGPNIVKIPENGAKLFVNCAYSYEDNFSVSKIPNGIFDLLLGKQKRNEYHYYHKPDGQYKLEMSSHQDLFCMELDVKVGEHFLLKTKSFGLGSAFYITDDQGEILSQIRSDDISLDPFILKIPERGTKLYVNCGYDYVNHFELKPIPKNLVDFISKGGLKEDYTFYYSADSVSIKREMNSGMFSIHTKVKSDQYYLIDTMGMGVANEWYVTDSNGIILQQKETNGLANGEQIVLIQKGGTDLYVNCKNDYAENFQLERVPRVLAENIGNRINIVKETSCFYYSISGSVVKYEHPDFNASIVSVISGEKYDIETQTYGIALEYLIADEAGNVLEYKSSSSSHSAFTVKVPKGATKLYVNCLKDNEDDLKIALSAEIDKSVTEAFPTISQFGVMRQKCPNFYKKFKEKKQDVCVVITGTSLSQGNLYTTDRDDATSRPAALHTNDLASHVFDVLSKHWDGQKYRRYDHPELSYSNSNWSVLNQLPNNVWDDYAHIKNGLTKTTTDGNASVSIIIPENAWQFNFVYRSDSQSGSCVITIDEGNGKVEMFNGSNWVEANGATFTMYEPPADETKGNTQYQKRLKMRCKNKLDGGINSIGSEKRIHITKGDNTNRFNVVGFEWSPREYMFSLINGARGGFEWGDPNGNRLDRYQETDIWSFNPDLLLAEVTIINWGASEPSSLSKDPQHYVNIAKRAYFNEFNDMPTSLYAKSNGYTKCDVVFYSDTLAASSAVSDAWESISHEPKFGTVIESATNGAVDNSNIGRVKTNFENYEAVESYMASKDYIFVPILSTFKSVAERYYGDYWTAMQPSGANGSTLSIDGVHFNNNGAKLFAILICSLFEHL